MQKHYPWLWFDADGTLFDYNRAEEVALAQAFQALNLHYSATYLGTYQHINKQLWQALERQEITPTVLQVRRFELLLEALQLTGSPSQFSQAYVEQLALCAELIDGAYDVLTTLQKTCRVAIVTNGLQAVQTSRVAHSTIRGLITDVIISEEVGAAKPHPAFFDAAFARLGSPAKRDVLVIGDSLTSDMKGGVDYGLDTCWFNPAATPRPADLPLTYEIRQLRELLALVN